MPTKRRKRAHPRAIVFDHATRVHLEIGDCLLAGGPGEACHCGLRGPGGEVREDLVRAAQRHFGMPEGPLPEA